MSKRKVIYTGVSYLLEDIWGWEKEFETDIGLKVKINRYMSPDMIALASEIDAVVLSNVKLKLEDNK